jgi:hypothetical protein
MGDVLVKIKRLILKGRYRFSEKASLEMEAAGITEFDNDQFLSRKTI